MRCFTEKQIRKSWWEQHLVYLQHGGTENFILKLQIASCSVIYSLNQNLYKKNIPAVMQSIIQLPECFAFKQR